MKYSIVTMTNNSTEVEMSKEEFMNFFGSLSDHKFVKIRDEHVFRSGDIVAIHKVAEQ